MFLDLDASEHSGLANSLKRLFGFGATFEQEITTRIKAWVDHHPASVYGCIKQPMDIEAS